MKKTMAMAFLTALFSNVALADVAVHSYENKVSEPFTKIIHISGEEAAHFYERLNVLTTKLTPWENFGKRILDSEGNIQIQCMIYEKSNVGCDIVLRK
jgi:hypothetical protein